jgi:hypothetical protein
MIAFDVSPNDIRYSEKIRHTCQIKELALMQVDIFRTILFQD